MEQVNRIGYPAKVKSGDAKGWRSFKGAVGFIARLMPVAPIAVATKGKACFCQEASAPSMLKVRKNPAIDTMASPAPANPRPRSGGKLRLALIARYSRKPHAIESTR